jgi:chromosome segregation ATPase
MSDQCKNCTVRGDINLCNNTPCSIHESWRDIDIMYQLAAKDRELDDRDKRLLVLNAELTGCIKDAEYQEKDLIDTRIELSSARQEISDLKVSIETVWDVAHDAQKSWNNAVEAHEKEMFGVRQECERLELDCETLKSWNVDKKSEISRLTAELADAKYDLEEGNGAYRAVMNEICAGDEIHCTCVPHLRRGIAELKAELGKYKLRMTDPIREAEGV